MIDLDEQLRAYFDEVDPPFDIGGLKRGPQFQVLSDRRRVGRGVLIAVATAAVILLFAGLPFLFSGGQDDTVIEPPVATGPSTTIDAAPTTISPSGFTDPALVADLLGCLPLDPVGWSQSEPLPGPWMYELRLASSNGVAVALGVATWQSSESGELRSIDQVIAYRSTDGLAWEPAVGIPEVEHIGLPRPNVAGGPRGFVMVANSPSYSDGPSAPIVASSDDGAFWEQIDPENLPKQTVQWTDVIAGPDGFIILGDSGTEGFVWYSADGRTWVESETPTDGALPIAVVSTDSGWMAIAIAEDAYLDAERWESTDGITWTEAEIHNAPPPGEFFGWFRQSPQIVVGDTWVLANDSQPTSDAIVWVSDDRGMIWNEYPMSGDEPSYAAEFYDLDVTSFGLLLTRERLLSRAAEVLYYSQDGGVTWQQCETAGGWGFPGDITQVTTIDDTLILFDKHIGIFHTWTKPTAAP